MMAFRYLILAIACLLCLASAVPPKPVEPAAATKPSSEPTQINMGDFPVSEYESIPIRDRWPTDGATIVGQVFLRTVGGDVRKGAGELVMVTPVTSYSRRFVLALTYSDNPAYIVRLGNVMRQVTEKMEPWTNIVQADGDGKYSFRGIPNGEWYLISNLTWLVAGELQGGFIVVRVSVDGKKEYTVQITR